MFALTSARPFVLQCAAVTLRFRLLLAVMLLATMAVPLRVSGEDETAATGERILQYHSRIEVGADASLQVSETILVRALGEQIRHGIYRDFPTAYRDRFGNRYRVRFSLDSARRDAAPEIARVENTTRGVRIYLGDKNALVASGVHEYIINYRVTRELGFPITTSSTGMSPGTPGASRSTAPPRL